MRSAVYVYSIIPYHWVGHCSNGCVKFEFNVNLSKRKTILNGDGLLPYIPKDIF